MRTSKVLSISLPPDQYEMAAARAKQENRTMSELLREALRAYEQNAALREQARIDILKDLQLIWAEAAANGTDKMTMEEIDAEIADARKQQREMARTA